MLECLVAQGLETTVLGVVDCACGDGNVHGVVVREGKDADSTLSNLPLRTIAKRQNNVYRNVTFVEPCLIPSLDFETYGIRIL
jgi:hypothetical protein